MDSLSQSAGRSGRPLYAVVSHLLRRLALGIVQTLSRLRRHRERTIAADEAPRRVLLDIGLLDGRQVIPLRRDDDGPDRWR